MFFGRKQSKLGLITEKCKAELEEVYTELLTLKDVHEWHHQRALKAESSVIRYADDTSLAKEGYYTLWQSSLHEENKVIRNRVIYALAIEEDLKTLLDEGKGAHQIIN